MAVALGHNDEFGEGAVELSGTAEKAKGSAGMRSPDQALIAPPARNGRFDGHAVPRSDTPHAGADGLDDGRAFVAQADGIAEVEVAHPRLREVVDIAAADSDQRRPQEDIVFVPDLRDSGLTDLDPTRGRQNGGLHLDTHFMRKRISAQGGNRPSLRFLSLCDDQHLKVFRRQRVGPAEFAEPGSVDGARVKTSREDFRRMGSLSCRACRPAG